MGVGRSLDCGSMTSATAKHLRGISFRMKLNEGVRSRSRLCLSWIYNGAEVLEPEVVNDDADVLTGLCFKRDDVRVGRRALVTTSVL